MGMFYCHGCDSYHDSKDGEYNVTADGKEYCDSTKPCESEDLYAWLEKRHLGNLKILAGAQAYLNYGGTDLEHLKKLLRVPQNPATYIQKGEQL